MSEPTIPPEGADRVAPDPAEQGAAVAPPTPGAAPAEAPRPAEPPRPGEPPRAAEPPRPSEPTSEPVAPAVTDPAGLSASEAAAAKRAETAAAVALVAAVASARAEQAALNAPAVEPAVEAPTRPSRLRALRSLVAMLLRGILVIALFVGGLALGNAWYQSNRTEAPTQVVDPATDGIEPPAIVREFIGALGSGDTDAVRSALAPEPHARLIGEFKRFDIQTITGVETLSTHVDGSRSATGIVMQGTTTGGVPISINLVILSDGNTIEGFR